MNRFSLMVHGGSGNIASIEPFRPALEEALEEGERLLKTAKSAVEIVRRCVMIMESHPRLNAGFGSALNEDGALEMEAAIMNGADVSVGAVAGVNQLQHPVELADLIRQDNSIVKLIGKGAVHYAVEHGLPLVDNDSLISDRQRHNYERWRQIHSLIIDGEDEKLGTVGAVAIDQYGTLAAATSTGGLVGKKRGRVGDTSTIGAGTFADRFAAISATGRGEDFVRGLTAGRIAMAVESGVPAKYAAQQAIDRLEAIGGRGGVIVVDRNYSIGSAKTSTIQGLVHGRVTSEMKATINLDPLRVS